MNSAKEYFAFISYSRKDEGWAQWLAHEIEHFHLPLFLNGRDDLPKELRPVFRDVEELSAGNLPQQICQALETSKHLVVVCSPNSARSEWVNKEIEEFIQMGRTNRIFPFIIDGIAMCKDPNDPQECFPPALRNLPQGEERVGANVHEKGQEGKELRTCNDCPLKTKKLVDANQGDINDKGRDAAVVKIVAGMLGVGFDMLWNRYERDKAEEERKNKEKRDHLYRVQSRFLAEKANDLADQGDSYTARLLALEALPNTLENPDRPYILEAERTFRKACSKNTAIIRGHTSGVVFASFSPNGKNIISASCDNTVCIWDTFSGELLHVLKHPQSLTTACYSNNGKMIAASMQYYESFYLWNTDNYSVQHIFHVDEGFIDQAFFSPDDTKIIAISSEKMVYVWDIQTKTRILVLRGHTEWINSALFSPNGQFIITSSNDKTVCIWDAISGELLGKYFNDAILGVNRAVMSHSDKSFAFVSCNTIQIGDISSMRIVRKIDASDFEVLYISYSPDGKTLVSCDRDNKIKTWDVETGRLKETYEGHTMIPYSANFNQDGSMIVSSSWDRTIRLWDCSDNIIIETGRNSVLANDTVLSPGGKRLMIVRINNEIEIISIDSKQSLVVFKDHSDYISSKVFSPDGGMIASASNDLTIKIWNSFTGKVIRSIKLAHKPQSVVFSPDSKCVLFSEYESIQIVDIFTGLVVFKVEADSQNISGFDKTVYSLDGKRIVTSRGTEICIFDAIAKTIVMKANMWPDPIEFVRFVPNENQLIYASEHSLFIFDIDTQKIIRELKGHVGDVFVANFSSDGKLLVTGAYDNTIGLWSMSDGSLLHSFQGHTLGISNVAFTSDGKSIISSSFDGTTRRWDYYSLQELIGQTNKRFENRPLTSEERKKYYLE